MVYIIYRFTWLNAQPASNEVLILMVNKLTPDTGPKGALVSLLTPRVAPVFLILLRVPGKGELPKILKYYPRTKKSSGLFKLALCTMDRTRLFLLSLCAKGSFKFSFLSQFNMESSGPSNLTPGNQGELRFL